MGGLLSADAPAPRRKSRSLFEVESDRERAHRARALNAARLHAPVTPATLFVRKPKTDTYWRVESGLLPGSGGHTEARKRVSHGEWRSGLQYDMETNTVRHPRVRWVRLAGPDGVIEAPDRPRRFRALGTAVNPVRAVRNRTRSQSLRSFLQGLPV